MRTHIGIIILLTFFCESAFSQSTHQVDSLLTVVYLTKESKDIIRCEQAKQLIAYGNKLLPILADRFTDTTLTTVKSTCQGRPLNKGEIAIILADNIEMMAYYTLTGAQNCLLEFCENNPNGIEFYLNGIKRNGVGSFLEQYAAWLNSNDRKKWPPYTAGKKLRKAKTSS